MTSELNNRYQILDLLGEGGSGKTYRALDIESQAEVAIKILSLYGMSDWKTLELFEREVKILSQLEHPSIPHYLDFVRAEVAGVDSYCLVQALAPGRSLTSWVESGYRFSIAELRSIAEQILEILIYLQTFTPPIIHRDLKPQNIIRTETGDIYLVDFGSVRDTYHLTITGGSTIVGTYGYMAPEQFRGQALLSTDLYGLGMTLLYLKSGRDPADLLIDDLKIDFRDRYRFTAADWRSMKIGEYWLAKKFNYLSPRSRYSQAAKHFDDWLAGLLQPIPEDRYCQARQALDILQGKESAKLARPERLLSQISYQGKTMTIVIPPIWLATRSSKETIAICLSIVFTLILLPLFIFWLGYQIELPDGDKPNMLWLVLWVLSLVFLPLSVSISIISLWRYINTVIREHELTITDRLVSYKTRIDSRSHPKLQWQIDREDIESVDCIRENICYLSPMGVLLLISKHRYFKLKAHNLHHLFLPQYTIGSYLDYPEQKWLQSEIVAHLDK
jgi:serine/threonine protein kinase